MRKLLFITAGVAGLLMPQLSAAATVIDPIGDFLPTYTGPKLGALDVTGFTVDYDNAAKLFTLGATFAGAIDPTTAASYVIGVNTGTGTIRPFAALGEPNVIFNQALTINANGTGTLGGTALEPSTISILGNALTAKVALSLLPSTGFTPEQYGFNLWPRFGGQIPDFAPDNATLSAAAGAVPEPATWAMMILGMGAVGYALRRSRRTTLAIQAWFD